MDQQAIDNNNTMHLLVVYITSFVMEMSVRDLVVMFH